LKADGLIEFYVFGLISGRPVLPPDFALAEGPFPALAAKNQGA